MTATSDISFGATYGRVDGAIDPLVFVEQCEALGFDSIWTPDVFHWPSPDPLIFLAGAAARTSRVSLGTAVGVLPYRHPILWAKAAISLQQLSHGRFILGVGIGGDFPQELEMLGLRMKDRGKMSDETLAVIKRLLTEKKVTHQGKFFQFQDVTIGVPPGGLAPIPIWYGAEWHNGIADRVSVRTAKFCDGFIPLGVPADAYPEVRGKIETYAHQEGRDLSSFTWGLYLWCLLGDSWEEARGEAERLLQVKLGPDWRLENPESYALGTPNDFIETIEKYISAGVSYFIISPVCIGDQVMSQYETLAREVLPHFKKKRP